MIFLFIFLLNVNFFSMTKNVKDGGCIYDFFQNCFAGSRMVWKLTSGLFPGNMLRWKSGNSNSSFP